MEDMALYQPISTVKDMVRPDIVAAGKVVTQATDTPTGAECERVAPVDYKAAASGSEVQSGTTETTEREGIASEASGEQPVEMETTPRRAVQIVAAKELSRSDVANQILRAGRIVLPRAMMEQNFDNLLQRLGLEDKSIEGVKGPLSYQTVMFGEKEEPWHVYLKRWKAEREDGAKTKAIYVLENVAEYLGTYGADEGNLFTLYIDECGRLSGRLDKKKSTITVGKSDGASELQIKAMGKCTRRPSCQKPKGHSGFCNGAVIFRPKRKEAPVDKDRDSERERESMFRRLLKEISHQRQKEAAHQSSVMRNSAAHVQGRREASQNELREVVSNTLGNQYQGETQQQSQGWKSAWATQMQHQSNPNPYASVMRSFQDSKQNVQNPYSLSDYLRYQREQEQIQGQSQQQQQEQQVQRLFAGLQRANPYQDQGRPNPIDGFNRSIDPLTRSQSDDAQQTICESLLSLKYGNQSQNARTAAVDVQAPGATGMGGDQQMDGVSLLQQIRCCLEHQEHQKQQQRQQRPMDQHQPSFTAQDLPYHLQTAQQHPSSAIDPGITALLTTVFSRMTPTERKELKETLKKSLLQQTLEMISTIS